MGRVHITILILSVFVNFFEMGSKSSLDINTEKMGGAKFLGESWLKLDENNVFATLNLKNFLCGTLNKSDIWNFEHQKSDPCW